MPTCHIVRESSVIDSFRVQQVRGMFEFSDEKIRHEWNSVLPVEDREWSIGLIVGASGSGKSTLAKEAFPDFAHHEGFDWSKAGAVVDGFPPEVSTRDVCATMNAVGFSSPPHWLKPFSHLSTGQKFRVELARCMLANERGMVFDEFTSVIDRNVAKIGCAAISKALRKRNGPPFVAVSCHYDIIDWLQPDWIFDVTEQRFEWRERRRCPEIKIDIYETTVAAWKLFGEHHYLARHIIPQAQCFMALWNGEPVGFVSYCHFPHPSSRYIKIGHRMVVLPDYQGIGIGMKLFDFVADHACRKGNKFYVTASHPSAIHYWHRSPLWIMKRIGRANGNRRIHHAGKAASASSKRITGGFEYVGLRKENADRIKTLRESAKASK